MPAYLNSLNNLILRSNIPADKDPREYGKTVEFFELTQEDNLRIKQQIDSSNAERH